MLACVVYTTLLTWISIMLGAVLRNREWTLEAAVSTGITYVRSALWGVGVVGLGLMLIALL